MARPGSLKRAAIEAEEMANRVVKRRRIDFGCEVPFKSVPEVVKAGFELQQKVLQRGDSRVREHY